MSGKNLRSSSLQLCSPRPRLSIIRGVGGDRALISPHLKPELEHNATLSTETGKDVGYFLVFIYENRLEIYSTLLILLKISINELKKVDENILFVKNAFSQ